MKASRVYYDKSRFPDGSIIEIVIWELPNPVPGSDHLYKYRMFYGRDGRRIVGYDNERGKGDHCHLDDVEIPYAFVSPDRLITDFLAEVRKRITR
jgi:hypothetical protein